MKVFNWINQKCYSEVLNKSQCIPYHNQSTKYTHRTVYNNKHNQFRSRSSKL